MRYILNGEGYIEEISFSNEIECNNKTCTEYTGTIPDGYSSLAEWSENAVIQAYKITDGNLTYDADKETELLSEWASQQASKPGITINDVYPVGSIYMSVNNTNPATLFGGTWERIQGRFLLAANDSNTTYNAGKTGGSVTKTLTVANLPSHDHGASSGNFISTSSSASPGTEMSFEAGQYRRYAMSKTSKTGSGTPLDIMPPWIAVYVWKRTA